VASAEAKSGLSKQSGPNRSKMGPQEKKERDWIEKYKKTKKRRPIIRRRGRGKTPEKLRGKAG